MGSGDLPISELGQDTSGLRVAPAPGAGNLKLQTPNPKPRVAEAVGRLDRTDDRARLAAIMIVRDRISPAERRQR
ncbi:MAG: hypothetical protein NTX53_05900 [candidate division WOR-3 bacterium]|nr:hypothetical protein [candidate division WOR-3 bacterium]